MLNAIDNNDFEEVTSTQEDLRFNRLLIKDLELLNRVLEKTIF